MLVKDYIKKHGDAHFQSVLTEQGKETLHHPNWIITDMRFPNEMEAVIKRKGITIKVNRPGIDLLNHPSETSLDTAEFDYTIVNDSTIEDLVIKVRKILVKEKII